MRQPLIDAVRGLDPAKGAPDLDDEQMLARIRARARGARPGDVAHLVPRPRSRPARRLAMGAAALTAIVAVALVLTLVQRGPTAYASWVAHPTLVDTATVAQICPTTDLDTPIEPVIAERRGQYTYAILTGENVLTECLISTAGDELFVVAQGVQPADDDAFTVDGPPALVVVPGTSWPIDGGEGPITTVVGLANDGVTGIRITTTDGVSADAAVVDGWWTVWFPGEVEVSDDLVVITPDGESTYSLDGLLAPGLG